MEIPSNRPDDTSASHCAPKSFLYWWAVIPVVAYIAIHVIWGWPQARILATSRNYAISYFGGRLLAPLFIALLLGWIAFRLSGRLRIVATAMFTIILALSVATVLAPVHPSNRSSQFNPATADKSPVQSFDRFQFETPSGWQRIEPQTKAKTTLVTLVPDGSALAMTDAILLIDRGKPQTAFVRDAASRMAQKFGGRVLPDPIFLDGVEAAQVEIPSTTVDQPQRVVAAIRDHQLYLIMIGGNRGAELTQPFDYVIQTWKWSVSE